MRWSSKSQLKFSVWLSLFISIIFSGQLYGLHFSDENQILIDVNWLVKHQYDPELVIVDARSKADYKKGHINGAINIPVKATFNPKINTDRVGNIKYIAALFSNAGISNDHAIVIYDGNSYIDAGRVFWVLEVYGHKKVKLLNGGIEGWKISAKQSLSQIETLLPVSDYIPTINSKRFITKFSMQLAIEDKDTLVIDSRDKKDFDGETSIASRSGHIPSAINIPWTENFVEVNGVKMLKPVDELLKIYAVAKQGRRVILYCNKGKQSSLSYTVMRQLGYDAAHYDGSWYEWANDPALPIVEKIKSKNKIIK